MPKCQRRFPDMKRNMELARRLLKQVEEGDEFDGTGGFGAEAFPEPDHSSEEIAYHLVLLIRAGLLEGTVTYDIPIVSSLTWEGHEFLDNTANPDIWAAVKKRAEQIGGMGLAMLGELAKAEMKKKLGLQ
jgi:hypothetical protein